MYMCTAESVQNW